MPHLAKEPQHFYKTAEEKSIHRQDKKSAKSKAIAKKKTKDSDIEKHPENYRHYD